MTSNQNRAPLLCLAASAMVFGVSTPVAHAQESAVAEQDIKDSFDSTSGITRSGGPNERDGSGVSTSEKVAISSFQLASEEGNIFANASVSISRGDVNVSSTPNGFRVSSWSDHFSLKLSVPINKKESDSILNFKRLGDDLKVSLGYTKYQSVSNTGAVQQKNLAKFGRACLIAAGEEWQKDNPGLTPSNLQEISGFVRDYDAGIAQSRSWTGAIKRVHDSGSYPEFTPTARSECDPRASAASRKINGNDQLARIYAEQALTARELKEYRTRYLNSGSFSFWGASISSAYEKYDVLNRAAFSTDTVDRVSFDGTAYWGRVFQGGKLAVKVSGGLARGYEEEDAAEICRATAMLGEQECKKAPDGLPKRKDTPFLKGEMRYVLATTEDGAPKVAIAPEISYDFKDKQVIFDVPVYLQSNKENQLDAGIRFGFKTGKNEFGVGVFVGIPLTNLF